MENVNLPTQKAREPDEDAHQPQPEEAIMAPQSQNSNAKMESLSQPPSTMSHRQRMLWLQKRRSTGLWVECDECGRWRYLAHVLDKHELPRKWYCKLNPDPAAASCTAPEASMRIRDEEDLIHSEYNAGSVVWAYMPGWPWWPAMVDDCPDTEQYYWLDGFSDIPTHYNVVFFDATDITRAWIAPDKLKPYAPNKKYFNHLLQSKKYKKRLEAAIAQADDADMLPLAHRLAKYSFVGRYPGAVNPPKTFTKKELKKFQDKLKRKYHVAFSDESSAESDNDQPKKKANKRSNVIILGTPSTTKKRIEEEDTFKQPNSLAVQVGSSTPTGGAVIEPSFDNDTSKTYVAGSESETESGVTETIKQIQERVASPTSDDFDF